MIVLDGVEMVDVREAARLAGRTPETIRRWVWSGEVESVKQGNRLLVPRDAILVRVPSSSSADETGADRQPSTLREWALRVARREGGRPGVTASDLVLEDRDARQSARPDVDR